MIPALAIDGWREFAPWGDSSQVEQDLVLTRAIIEIYSDPFLREAFAFRGGTALQKLFFNQPTRYSEDIDLVQIRKEAIGPAIDAIRKHIDPWLGEPRRTRKTDRVTLIYRFQSEVEPIRPMRLKIEINNGEHLTVLKLQRIKLQAKNSWFTGEADTLTYEIEELLGTKLRALYQRKKGRDLFDMGRVLQEFSKLDSKKVIQCFKKYLDHEGSKVTRAEFEKNLDTKIKDRSFIEDIVPLLAPGAEAFDPIKVHEKVKAIFLSQLSGEPWKGLEKREGKKPKK
jgi:predicted nucleotidyltransferase component of viral defense system